GGCPLRRTSPPAAVHRRGIGGARLADRRRGFSVRLYPGRTVRSDRRAGCRLAELPSAARTVAAAKKAVGRFACMRRRSGSRLPPAGGRLSVEGRPCRPSYILCLGLGLSSRW